MLEFPGHLLSNCLTDSNETCLLCSPQCLVVQVQKKIRSVDKFGLLVPGSDLVKFPWSDVLFRSWSECSPQCLVVQGPKEIRSVEKHGRRRPSLIFLVIASPKKLLCGFEWNLPIRLDSMSSSASTKPNSGRSTNFTFLAPSSDLVKRSIRHLVIASPLEPLNGVDRYFPT